MWTLFKTKKLSTLAILAGLTYAFLIISTFVDGWDDFQTGFHDGAQTAKYNSNGKDSENKPLDSYSFLVKSKNGFASYPDSLVNLKSNTTIKSKCQKVIVLSSSDSHSSTRIYNFLMSIFGFLIFANYILIPIQFYRLMGLIQKNILFERENIRLLRWLGIELLIVYFGNVLFNYMSHQMDCSLFSFSEYEIVMESADGIWLLFGIVALLIAEIFTKALVIKEEQELTI